MNQTTSSPQDARLVRELTEISADSRFSRSIGAGLAAALGLFTAQLEAATVTWTAPSSTNLAGTSNWTGTGSTPTTSDEAVFTSVPSPDLVSGNTLTWGDLVWNTNTTGSIKIGSGASGNRVFTLSGGAGSTAAVAAGGATGDLIVLGDNVTSGTLTLSGETNAGGFNLRPAIGAVGNFNVKNAGATLVISSPVSGNFALTKTGAGTLTLSNFNSFSAGSGFTVAAGTVNANQNHSLGSGNVSISGGALAVNSAGVGTVTLEAGKSFAMSGGALRISFASAASYDQILGSGGGAFNITGGVLDLTNSISDYSVTYTLFSGFGPGSVSGLSIVNYDTANYIASLGTNGVLSFSASSIPEPSTYAMIAGLLTLGISVVRRRRKD